MRSYRKQNGRVGKDEWFNHNDYVEGCNFMYVVSFVCRIGISISSFAVKLIQWTSQWHCYQNRFVSKELPFQNRRPHYGLLHAMFTIKFLIAGPFVLTHRFPRQYVASSRMLCLQKFVPMVIFLNFRWQKRVAVVGLSKLNNLARMSGIWSIIVSNDYRFKTSL